VAVLDLKYYGDPVLRKVASPIKDLNGDTAAMAGDLIETMRQEKGIGLAANQIGRAIRMYAVDPSVVDPREKPFVLINPKIIEAAGEHTGEEGCLSFPGLYEIVSRPNHVLVEALDINGNPMRLEREGLIARVLLHEYDHLEGKLFIDYFGFLQRQLYRNRLRRLKSGEIEVFR
jgi:peptide deformylase